MPKQVTRYIVGDVLFTSMVEAQATAERWAVETLIYDCIVDYVSPMDKDELTDELIKMFKKEFDVFKAAFGSREVRAILKWQSNNGKLYDSEEIAEHQDRCLALVTVPDA
jgi:hypothetical protein